MTDVAAGGASEPLVGMGFRLPIKGWILKHRAELDVLEVTVDHYICGGEGTRAAFRDLVGRIPLVGHGVGLSIGTDLPLDEEYVEQVAQTIDDLKLSFFSEHLALTKVPGIDLANLVPLPRTEEVAVGVIERIARFKQYISVPFHLENISYLFDYPDSEMSEVEFLRFVCREAGVGLHLDVENLRANAANAGFDAYEFLDELPADLVACVHVAGGLVVERDYLDGPFTMDSHSHPVSSEMLDLLGHALQRQHPHTIVLERDERISGHVMTDDDLPEIQEILPDLARIRACVSEALARRGESEYVQAESY